MFLTYFSLLVLHRHVKMEEPASPITTTILTTVSVNKASWENVVRKVIDISALPYLYSKYAVAKTVFEKINFEFPAFSFFS